MNAAVGGAAVLSMMVSVAAPAQADPLFQSSKPALQEMKVRSSNPCTAVDSYMQLSFQSCFVCVV